jgi:hypothetical protein
MGEGVGATAAASGEEVALAVWWVPLLERSFAQATEKAIRTTRLQM